MPPLACLPLCCAGVHPQIHSAIRGVEVVMHARPPSPPAPCPPPPWGKQCLPHRYETNVLRPGIVRMRGPMDYGLAIRDYPLPPLQPPPPSPLQPSTRRKLSSNAHGTPQKAVASLKGKEGPAKDFLPSLVCETYSYTSGPGKTDPKLSRKPIHSPITPTHWVAPSWQGQGGSRARLCLVFGGSFSNNTRTCGRKSSLNQMTKA